MRRRLTFPRMIPRQEVTVQPPGSSEKSPQNMRLRLSKNASGRTRCCGIWRWALLDSTQVCSPNDGSRQTNLVRVLYAPFLPQSAYTPMQSGWHLHRSTDSWIFPQPGEISAVFRYPRMFQSFSPALLPAIYVWGMTLSRSPDVAAYEPGFLSRALHHAAMAPTSTRPNKAKHSVQAETVAFIVGSFLKCRVHRNVATKIAIVYRVHTPAGVVETNAIE